jgi:hypothetical protein
MKPVMFGLGILLIGAGIWRLIPEIQAISQLDDVSSALKNAKGVGAEARSQEMRNAFLSGGPDQLGNVIAARLDGAPFDPVLLALGAVVQISGTAEGSMQLSARLLDQAQAIAPGDRRVMAIRHAVQFRLQRWQPE